MTTDGRIAVTCRGARGTYWNYRVSALASRSTMACRGVHFALESDDERAMLDCADEDAVVELVQEVIENKWDEDWLFESDKAWDAIHRCLTDGKLEPTNGTPPLSLAVFGGRHLCDGGDYYVCYVAKALVAEVAAALQRFDRSQFDVAYDALAGTDYDGPHDDEDREYTWENLEGLKAFWAKAAAGSRSVIFTVDQ